MFYVMNFFGALVFIKISRNWRIIMDEWVQTEITLKCYREVKSFKRRLIITSVIVAVLATGKKIKSLVELLLD